MEWIETTCAGCHTGIRVEGARALLNMPQFCGRCGDMAAAWLDEIRKQWHAERIGHAAEESVKAPDFILNVGTLESLDQTVEFIGPPYLKGYGAIRINNKEYGSFVLSLKGIEPRHFPFILQHLSRVFPLNLEISDLDVVVQERVMKALGDLSIVGGERKFCSANECGVLWEKIYRRVNKEQVEMLLISPGAHYAKVLIAWEDVANSLRETIRTIETSQRERKL